MASGQLYPHTGFIVTNLARPAERVVGKQRGRVTRCRIPKPAPPRKNSVPGARFSRSASPEKKRHVGDMALYARAVWWGDHTCRRGGLSHNKWRVKARVPTAEAVLQSPFRSWKPYRVIPEIDLAPHL